MALTKERKILIAVAGLACGIFFLDRALLGGSMSGPTQAEAAGSNTAFLDPASDAAIPPLDDSATAVDLDMEFSSVALPTTSLAQRLAEAGRHLPSTTPDAFHPSSRWQTPGAPVISDTESPTFNPRAFADRNPLDAVFASPQGATAMIAGQALRLGDTRDGMILAEIGDRWVVWSGGGVRVKVHLDPVR